MKIEKVNANLSFQATSNNYMMNNIDILCAFNMVAIKTRTTHAKWLYCKSSLQNSAIINYKSKEKTKAAEQLTLQLNFNGIW